MSLKHTLLVLLLLISCNVFAQGTSYGLGGWTIVTVNLPGNTQHRLGGFFEAQVRNYGVMSKFFYHEEKIGVSYNFDNNSYALLGTGRYTTYGIDAVDEGPQITENRLWEQFTTNQFIGRVKLEHRFRIEQRWLNTGYRNRYRYRLILSVPINHKALDPNTFFASALGEVFFNNTEPNLERNRFSPTLGYKFSKQFTLQLGYMNQRNYAAITSADKDFLIMIVTYNIPRK